MVPDIHVGLDGLRSDIKPRIIKTHYMPNVKYPRIIYLVRDGRDSIVSFFDFHKKLNGYRREFDRFVHDVCLGKIWPGAWHDHVMQWINWESRKPFLLVRYEDLLHNPIQELDRLVRFVGLEVSEKKLELAVSRSSLKSNWKKFQEGMAA